MKRLPLAPRPEPGKRKLPLADDVREVDRVRPIYAVWELTLRCDLACRHCGSRAGHSRPDELDRDEALALVEQIADLGVREVTLIGGEAYLREDWLDIAAAIVKRRMLCSVTTGGRGMTPERARGAAAAGVEGMSVSIDGLRAAHDRLRGVAGSWDAAMAAIAAIRGAGMRVSVNTQINARNVHDLRELFARLVAAGITAWQPQLTAALGRAADEDDLLLQPYELIDLFPVLADLAQTCAAKRILFWPGNSIGYFGPYEHVLRGHLPGGHRGSCGAGRATLGIEANGAIKGCPSLPTESYVGGNVRDAPLREIWERGHALRFTRDQTVEDLRGFCRTCYYADVCKAGCNFTAHALLGAIGDNPFCHHRALELRDRGERERIVRVADAPGQPFDHGRFEIVREPW